MKFSLRRQNLNKALKSQNVRRGEATLDATNKKNKGTDAVMGERDMCLTIAEGPESLTREFEIDMMGTRKPLKANEAFSVVLTEHFFYLNGKWVLFIQKRKIETQNSISPKRTSGKRSVPEELKQTKACDS